MARTLLSTDSITSTLHYLLKKNTLKRNAEALAFADEILDNELRGYPVGAQYALVYTYIAVAYSRSGIPADPLLRRMMDSVHPVRMSHYVAKYYELVVDHESRTHPFCLYMIHIAAALRYPFKRSGK